MFGKKSKAVVAGLSLVMALAPAVPAFAEGEPSVKKTLQTNAGSSVANATFKFSATPKTINLGNGTTTGSVTWTPQINDITLNETKDETTKEGTAAVTFGDWPAPGVYAWTIRETADTYEGVGDMQYDPQVYTLFANVTNGTNGYDVSYVIVKGDTDTFKNDNSKKTSSLDFTNKFTETNTENNKPFTITKTVTGDQGDQNKNFEFTVVFHAPNVLPEGVTPESYLAAITATGATDFANNAGTVTFKLKHGQTATFNNIVAGTTYTVDETDVAGYTTTGEITEAKTLSEDGSEETVTNAFNDVTPTGLVINNAPFIVMIGAAAAGVVAYGSAKRKLEK